MWSQGVLLWGCSCCVDWSRQVTKGNPQTKLKCKEQIYFTVQYIFHSSWPLSLSSPHFQYRFLLKVCHSQEVITVLLGLCSHQHTSECVSVPALLALDTSSWHPGNPHGSIFWGFELPSCSCRLGKLWLLGPFEDETSTSTLKKGVQKRVLGSTICSGF